MDKKYTYTWDKTGLTYDVTSVVEMSKKCTPADPIQKELMRIMGCNSIEALDIGLIIDRQFRPKSQQPQQPTKPPVPTCPRCGSTAITAGARGVNGFLGFIGASKTVNRCANCGNTWTPKYK